MENLGGGSHVVTSEQVSQSAVLHDLTIGNFDFSEIICHLLIHLSHLI